MRKLSIKLRVTIWFTTLMTLLVILILGFLLSTSKRLVIETSKNKLNEAVNQLSARMRIVEGGTIVIENGGEDFGNDVYLSVYNSSGALIYGTTPEGYDNNVSFYSGKIQVRHQEEETWLVVDSQYKAKHEMFWIRGILSAKDAYSTFDIMYRLVVYGLPVLVIFAAVGGYLITRRAFFPIQKITEAADKIGEGKDLTKRIQLGDGKDEVYALANTFDRMIDRLQASFENEKQFTSDASHELRTPITVIIAQCEYTLEHAQTMDETKEALQKILQQSEKMSNLISQLLTLARADKGQDILNLERINLSELTEIVADQQRDLAQERKIRIISQIQPDILIYGDETMLMRMLINLISNGIQYGKQDGTLTITLNIQQSQIVLSVTDDGIGIAKENINKIWRRFYQVDPSRTSCNSSVGLGLSMVKWIATAHGGSIFVESEIGKGSTFTVLLPIKEGVQG